MDEQEKEIEEILRTFDKAPSPSSENITLADYDFTYEIKDKFPKNQLTPNGLPAHQIKQNTKDKLSQAKWIFGLKTNRSVIKGEAYYV